MESVNDSRSSLYYINDTDMMELKFYWFATTSALAHKSPFASRNIMMLASIVYAFRGLTLAAGGYVFYV